LSGQVTCGIKPVPASKVEIVAGSNAGTSATADSEGRYVLDALEGGTMVVRASAPGYEPRTADVVLDANKSADFLLAEESATAPQRVTLSGIVRATSASHTSAVSNALVTITAGENRGKAARTNSAGHYQLADLIPEEVTVEASAAGYGSTSQRVALRENTVADITLTLTTATALTGRAVDLLSQTPLAGISAAGEGLTGGQTDSAGAFTLTTSSAVSGVREVTFSGSRIFERRLRLELPLQEVTISLIPSDFDMAAFDQMFRSPGLRRWTTAPPLVVEQRAVQFTTVDMNDAVGVADVMAAAEAESLVGDLTWALGALTGSTFRSFQRVSPQTSPEASNITLLNPGVITVVRVVGLHVATGKWGWSRWLYTVDGEVFGGLMMLDRDFDRTPNLARRALRAHELGHALGYDHVTGRQSVMNHDGRLEPTAFDLAACRIAFQRQPGSRSPDIDADVTRLPQATGSARWSPPVH
jgi:hypothetical protein